MKVCIVSFGKFHSFDLARELNNFFSVKVFSTYPFFIAKKYSITKKNFKSFFLLQLIDRATLRLLSDLLKDVYAILLIIIIPKNQDIYILWSDIPTFFYKYLKSKSPNSKIILERGSSHIESQYHLLKEEYSLLEQKFKFPKKHIITELENYNSADYISIPSKFVYNTFIKKDISKQKLFLNPYGADLSKFYPKKNIIKKKFTIMTCGLASIQKGFHYMLKAHELIEGDFTHIHVGNIDLIFKNDLRNYPNLKIINSISHDLLIDYYNQADILVIPSIQDGFGMVILEAMACGLPIISTHNTGFSTIDTKGSECGYIIDIRSPNQIAEKINLLNKDINLLNQFSFNSLKIISKGGYKWSDYGTRYSNFLNAIKR